MRIESVLVSALIAVLATAIPAAPAAPEDTRVSAQQGVDAAEIDGGDSRLTDRVKRALFADERIKARWVGVSSSAGNVTLSGQVDSAEVRDAAQAIAEGVPGVRTVSNHLQLLAPERGSSIVSAVRADRWTKIYLPPDVARP